MYNKPMRNLTIIIILLITVFVAGYIIFKFSKHDPKQPQSVFSLPDHSEITCITNNTSNSYSSVTSFKKGEILTFPDFNFCYLGDTHQTGPNNKLSIKTSYFQIISKDGRSMRTSWSSGLGDISATPFYVGNKLYSLELAYWEKEDTKLGNNQLVISPWKGNILPHLFRQFDFFDSISTFSPTELSDYLGMKFQVPVLNPSAKNVDFYESPGFSPMSKLIIEAKDDSVTQLSVHFEPELQIKRDDIIAMIKNRYADFKDSAKPTKGDPETTLIYSSGNKMSFVFNEKGDLEFLIITPKQSN